MEDLIYLIARHKVSVTVENRSFGTSKGDIYLSAHATAENEGRRLTALSSVWGTSAKMIELREEAIRGALAALRRQVEALEALK